MGLNSDILSIRAFVTFAETGTVTAAAERLNTTQSPMSRRLRELERNLGLTLFRNEGRGLQLTPEAERLLPEARRLLAANESLLTAAQSLSEGKTGAVRIGVVPGALYAGVLHRALRGISDIGVEVRQMRSSQQEQALLAGEIDLGLSYRASAQPGLTHRLVHCEPFMLASPEKADRLEGVVPFCAPHGSDDWIRAIGQTAGFQHDIRFRAEDPLSALTFVGLGLCHAIIQQALTPHLPPGVRITPLAGDAPSSMTIHLLHGSDPGPAALRVSSQV
ncbi:LysR family transcriptional regulator [Pseudooceanicola sp. MF1-13]|uniref:LysR family transcriptional regulator n=1 Tax=Pseudooceanicola sp. MF1-13 TaxID=3379095 RepID=UPI0038912192